MLFSKLVAVKPLLCQGIQRFAASSPVCAAIESVLAQTHANFELLPSDDRPPTQGKCHMEAYLPSQQHDQLMVQRAKKNPIALTGLILSLLVLKCPLISMAND